MHGISRPRSLLGLFLLLVALSCQIGVSQGPVQFSIQGGEIRPVQSAPKKTVKIGNRDDSLAEHYSLENRGQETPAGKKTGRYCTDGMQRAGYPWIPGLLASTGTDSKHTVGYVGGSTPFKGPYSGVLQGECRRPQEGNFGYDYSGLTFKRNTWLLWTHGRREQGGEGRYQTDGPRILPEK